MKYSLIGFIVAVIAVGAVVAMQRGYLGGNEPTASPTEEASPTPLPNYTLTVIVPTVSVKHDGTSAATQVSGTITVAQGDTVITSANGRARLRWPNDTITTIEPNSSVVLTELANDGNQSTLTLLVGDIWSRVSRILGVGEYYQVETQEAVAAVRGTVFRVSYREHVTNVQGIENTVRVYTRTPQGKADIASAVDVSEGNQAGLDARAATTTGGEPRRIQRRIISAQDKAEMIYQRVIREKGMRNELLLQTTTPSPSTKPIISSIPSPTPKPSILPSASVSVSPSTTVTPTSTPAPSVSTEPTATPLPPVTLQSVFPHAIAAGETFSLEGANFTSGRNISRISSVLVGGQHAQQFSVIIGGTSIFVQPATSLGSGTFDVSVITAEGETITLRQVITIQ